MITLRYNNLSRTPLVEWSARLRDLYLTTHNTHNRQISTSQHTTLTTHRPLPHNTQHSQHTDLYLTTHNTHNRQTSTSQHTTLTTDKHPCPGWDSNPRSQQTSGLYTYALDRAATGTSTYKSCNRKLFRVQQIPTVCYTRPGTSNPAVPS